MGPFWEMHMEKYTYISMEGKTRPQNPRQRNAKMKTQVGFGEGQKEQQLEFFTFLGKTLHTSHVVWIILV